MLVDPTQEVKLPLLTAVQTAGGLTGPEPSKEPWGGSEVSSLVSSCLTSAYGSTWARQVQT